jgi:hypothetical protein
MRGRLVETLRELAIEAPRSCTTASDIAAGSGWSPAGASPEPPRAFQQAGQFLAVEVER